jgi:hypothetical protein
MGWSTTEEIDGENSMFLQRMLTLTENRKRMVFLSLVTFITLC